MVGVIGLLLNASALYTILRGNTGITGGTGGASKSKTSTSAAKTKKFVRLQKVSAGIV